MVSNTKSHCAIHQASGPLQEVVCAIRVAQNYQHRSIPWSKIGLIVSDEAMFAPILKPLLEQAEIPHNFALPRQFRHTSEGLALEREFTRLKVDHSIGKKPFLQWFDSTKIFLSTLKSDEPSFEQALEYYETLNVFENFFTSEMNAYEFYRFLEKTLLSLTVHELGEPLSGLQVLSFAEARYLPLDVVIIFGCVEGKVPKNVPKDIIIHDHFKKSVNLPTFLDFEAMEDQTFYGLVERIPHVHLIFSAIYDHVPQVRSRYIEAFTHQKIEIQMESTQPLTGKSFETRSTPMSKLREGIVSADSHNRFFANVSSTSLKTFLECPYQFALRKLNVFTKKINDDDDDLDEGLILHEILKAFFESVNPDLSNGLDVLNTLTEQKIQKKSVRLHLATKSWPKFIAFLEKLRADHGRDNFRFNPAYKEFKFEHTLSVEGKNQPMILTGSIDAFELFPELAFIIDYKRIGSLVKSELRSGMNPQLALYADVVHGLFKLPVVAGIWKILAGEWSVGITEDHRESDLAAVKERLSERFKNVENFDQRFYADIAHCGFCEYRAMCRKDDKRFAEAFLTQRSPDKKPAAESAEGESTV